MVAPLFAVEPIGFRCAAPDSKKNRGHVIAWGARCRLCGQKPHHGYRPSGVAVAQEARLREYLEHMLRGDERPYFGDRSVRLVVGHYARSDDLRVRVEDMGPRPKGFTGRKRDLPNMLDVVCDALQGPVVENDNQVSEIVMRRLLG